MDPILAALFLPALESIIWAHCMDSDPGLDHKAGEVGVGAPSCPETEPPNEAGEALKVHSWL